MIELTSMDALAVSGGESDYYSYLITGVDIASELVVGASGAALGLVGAAKVLGTPRCAIPGAIVGITAALAVFEIYKTFYTINHYAIAVSN